MLWFYSPSVMAPHHHLVVRCFPPRQPFNGKTICATTGHLKWLSVRSLRLSLSWQHLTNGQVVSYFNMLLFSELKTSLTYVVF